MNKHFLSLKAFGQNFDARVLTQVLTSLLDVSLALFEAVFSLTVQDGGRPWFGKGGVGGGFRPRS